MSDTQDNVERMVPVRTDTVYEAIDQSWRDQLFKALEASNMALIWGRMHPDLSPQNELERIGQARDIIEGLTNDASGIKLNPTAGAIVSAREQPHVG